jgi:heme/copper-type cytochrome/quinol oxidase subunit 2
MTYAMLGIAAVVALMLGVALWRYRRSVMRKREIRWLDEHHVLDRLRKHLDPSVEK